jgi:hypothetical protein
MLRIIVILPPFALSSAFAPVSVFNCVGICFVLFESHYKMEHYLKSILDKHSSMKPAAERFDKILKHKETQSFVQVKDDDGPCLVVGFNKKQVQGTIIKVDDKIGNAKKKCSWVNVAWSKDENFFKSCEFIHEVAVGYLVRKHLTDLSVFSRASIVDVTCDSHRACIGFRNLSPAMEFEDVIHDLSTEDFSSILLQVFSALCVAQHRIKLKHHDLHLGNIMITPVEESYDEIVDTPFGAIKVPIKKFTATIIDYGLSSATDPETKLRHARIDEELLISRTRMEQEEDMGQSIESEDDEWGVWGPELEGDEGYDVAMLVESMTEELFKERPLNVEKIKIVASLQELVNINFTERGRPAEHCSIDWTKLFCVFA